MKIGHLRRLDLEKAIQLINDDLKVLLDNDLNTSHFGKVNEVKGLTIECSWSSISKSYGGLGYYLDRDTYNFVKGEKKIVEAESQFTLEEVEFLKSLYTKQAENNQKEQLEITARSGEKKTTGISVYTDTWQRFSDFKEKYAYSGTDILDTALKEFMDKYEK